MKVSMVHMRTGEHIVCFHNPEEQNGFLSNWYLSRFTLGSVTFSSMEQCMMYSKAVLFGDKAIAGEILDTHDVREIKALGRRVRGFVEETWIENREEIVTAGLRAKFRQDKELLKLLISTEDSILAECAVWDKIWGIGLSMTDPDRLDRSWWRGLNLLGKCLMAVREEFRF